MPWQDRKSDEAYPSEEIRERLAQELPRWSLEEGWICRRYRTAGWRATLMVVNAVGHLAEAAFHHPDLVVSYAQVTVKLQTHSAQGVTHKDFELARKIEELVTWQPQREGGALEGLPDDPRFKYVDYDT